LPHVGNEPTIPPVPPTCRSYEVTVTDYVGGYVYENGKLSRLHFDGGFYIFDADTLNQGVAESRPHFYFTDHLGNIRVVTDAEGYIEQTNSYYPYGDLMASSSSIATPSSSYPANQPYRYNGNEFDRKNGLDWMDYDARHFAGQGMWTSLDPLTEKYYDWSPYVYCIGNPINLLDTDGMDYYYWCPVKLFIAEELAINR